MRSKIVRTKDLVLPVSSSNIFRGPGRGKTHKRWTTECWFGASKFHNASDSWTLKCLLFSVGHVPDRMRCSRPWRVWSEVSGVWNQTVRHWRSRWLGQRCHQGPWIQITTAGAASSFHYFESCSQEKQKLLKRAIKAERGEQAQIWVGIVFELWRSLPVGKVDIMFTLFTLCFRTFNLTRAVQDKVSTNISRETELQALPGRWCFGFKLFFFTLLMVQHH